MKTPFFTNSPDMALPVPGLSLLPLLLMKSLESPRARLLENSSYRRPGHTALHRIRILSDGIPGHENQSLGLADALRSRTGAEVDHVFLDPRKSLMSRVKLACLSGDEPPQLLISSGHRTHFPLVAAARHFGARSVVLMKPTLPVASFDLCFVPNHDVRPGRTPGPNVIPTFGPPNRLPESPAGKSGEGLILIGGPSRHHHWDGDRMMEVIGSILRRDDFSWTIADSRRTPPGFLERIAANERVKIARHQDTGPDWLPRQLSAASRVWVTEDSISMIFEAITAHAAVGLLPMAWKKQSCRLRRSTSAVVAEGYAGRFEDWTGGDPLTRKAGLHEAARCANLVLSRFFRQP